MSNELVAYKPPPVPIPKSTLKKEELTLRERAWVWNDLLLAASSGVSLIVGIVWLSVPLTLDIIGKLALIGGIFGLFASVALFLQRAFSTGSALASANDPKVPLVRLSHEQRAELCRMDRNRRARPHRREFAYAPRLYSVWPTLDSFNGDDRGLHLVMLEHVRPRPYLVCYLLPRRLRFSQRAWWTRIAAVTIEDASPRLGIINLGMKPSESEVTNVFEQLENLALKLEEAPHQQKIEEFKAEEIMLNLRRQPPSVKAEAIQRARKALK